MWFIFPQLAGLGHSSMARRYAIRDITAARAYLRHPVLGARLAECTGLVLQVPGRRIDKILGTPDDLKFRSCMTLFAAADPEAPCYSEALQQYFGGQPDVRTLAILSAGLAVRQQDLL